ncbi:hypothetical protein EUTSA_v10024419mg [Eutrema salsugineum]|uniref:non-specific serine/threonine protein kinase n=1 Tax=Eutrema salsugineum TaxID=72664 RepID=V4LX42_EUTSA|nr:hypothetical protein EUTSA_v10024419mg [Eutrema salsugineum]
MRGIRNIYHHSYTFSFLLVFFVLILFHPALSTDVNILSSTESLTISNNRTIVSRGEVFELGFFKPSARSRWYLGIWYKKVAQRTYAWFANRDNPLSTSIGTLKIFNMNLVLLDHSNNSVWSTNLSKGNVRAPVVAELRPNGNFVMRYFNNDDPSGFLWQSFDFPTDTLLPGMKLDFEKHRSGPWDGYQFSGIPEDRNLNYMVYNFTESSEEVSYTFLMTNQSIYSRLTVSSSGDFQRYTWNPPSWGWSEFWTSPTDECDLYQRCGPYTYCDVNTSPVCNCLGGFDPKNPKQWDLRDRSGGCVRTQLKCSGDGFLRLKNMKLPDTMTAIVDRVIGLKKCEERCRRDCNCTAYANMDVRSGVGCVMWSGVPVDIRNYAVGGQDLYVRLDAADLGAHKNRNRNKIIIGWSTGVSFILLMSLITLYFWKRRQKRARALATPIAIGTTLITSTFFDFRNQEYLINGMVVPRKRHFSGENDIEDLELPLMEFEAIVTATDNFSDCNKLGEGGFGIVYKGRLPDGQEIAVKRLSQMSAQGTNEFMNEVRLIAKLQHINLVRLLGCCVDDGEKILVYEYLENLSLDSHLFDKTQSSKLNWQMRYDITNGIARGLLYLHQDSRCRIIHRDLKASNILLDKDMTPKISDFGMARIFGRDETEANTRKVVGTYGYMSPEYAMDGIFSMKSDVFSFGVLLLEIISGKRNKGFYNLDRDLNLLGCVWRNWKEGRGLEIVDPVIRDFSPTFIPYEILRCIQIGLLCVQERADDRPMMSSVVLMLGSEVVAIPYPKPPGYCVGRNSVQDDSSSTTRCDYETSMVNQITMSVIDAR